MRVRMPKISMQRIVADVQPPAVVAAREKGRRKRTKPAQTRRMPATVGLIYISRLILKSIYRNADLIDSRC